MLTYVNWEGSKVLAKSLFEQEARQIGTQKCSTKQGVRKPLHGDSALVKAEHWSRQKCSRRECSSNDPIKMKKMKGAFALNSLLIGTVRPTDMEGGAGLLRRHTRMLIEEAGFSASPSLGALLP